ncbi:hypothetical protein DEAC_c22220 [Desulfosporosinus acididurans]|uniref:Uncharacterized protein n=1 Tax=Desulfosporosinus acididurans TaxID=476652 RepID=A0A0J1FQN2_9FIRM|nr:hypothetical protein [Desulfosporosinus acididurans]KLU65592.1 hypothetical protein DEAC_c22220 [Desulfosporosinus acididurans]
MKILKVLIGADIFIILSGLSWLLIIPNFYLSAFNRPLPSSFLGMLVLLFGIYKGFHLRRTYLRLRSQS